MRELIGLFLPFLLLGEVHHIVPSKYCLTYSQTHPVLLRVKPGDTIHTKTIDAGGRDENFEVRNQGGIGLTGPFHLEGAEPGDALRVTIKRLRFNRKLGYTNNRLLLNAVLPEYVQNIYSARYKEGLVRPGASSLLPWDIDAERNVVRLREPVSTRVKFEFPVRPMIGSIGVAAPGETAPPSSVSGPYGGNMDYNEIGEGATLILPVYHPGGLLFMGDAHALQGDGEPIGTGVETSMDVEFTLDLQKQARLTLPRVETKDFLISIGSQPEFASDLDRALQMATTDMVRWLVSSYGLEPMAAHLLIGCQGRYDVVTVAGSMALRIPRRYLETPR